MNEEKVSRWMRDQLIEQARSFRKNPTQAETLLWEKLRKRCLGGLKFRRQHIIYSFIVDLYCPAAKLVIEIDGPVHEHQKEYDRVREKYLEELGYQIVRFNNKEVEEDIEMVLAGIYDACMRRIDFFKEVNAAEDKQNNPYPPALQSHPSPYKRKGGNGVLNRRAGNGVEGGLWLEEQRGKNLLNLIDSKKGINQYRDRSFINGKEIDP